jgi:peptide/nickel transport system substrate-binding protein
MKTCVLLGKAVRLLISVSLFTLCAIPFNCAAASSSPGAKAQYGGTLRISQSAPIVTLGYPPIMAGVTDGYASDQCLETLFMYNEKFTLVPRLAMGWKANASDKTITITLRKGVKFHDGSEFNADVVKWNLDQYRASKRVELKNVKSVDIVDPYTVRLNLSEFDNLVVGDLAGDAGRMISRKAFEEKGQAWCEKNPVGTGPFKFSSWMKDVVIKYVKNENYWQKGRPYLDGLEIVSFADKTTALLALKRGEIDILYDPSPKDAKVLDDEGSYKIDIMPLGPQPHLAGDSVNADSPFANLKVRQAVSHAIDTQAIAKALGYGYWRVQNQPAIPGSWAYNPKVTGYPYNPAKAKKLLAEAGYPNGFKTSLFFWGTPDRIREMEAVQGYLSQVGIDAKLESMDRGRFNEMATGGGWKNGLFCVLMIAKPDVLATIKHIVTPGSRMFVSMIRPTEYQDLFAKAISTSDEKLKRSLTHELMKMGTDKHCMANWLYVQTFVTVKSSKVHDDMYGKIPGLWLSPDAWLSR